MNSGRDLKGIEEMQLVELERDKTVFIVRMKRGKPINLTTVTEINAALDAVEASTGPACLVLTGEGKSFCPGFDPDTDPADTKALVGAGTSGLSQR